MAAPSKTVLWNFKETTRNKCVQCLSNLVSQKTQFQIKMTKQKTNKAKVEHTNVALPVPARGRIFEGTVTKKFSTRVVIEAERTVYVPKYERFYKKIMRVHARLPAGMNIEVGDYIKVQETRPLSKIIHAVVIEKVRSAHMEKAEAKK